MLVQFGNNWMRKIPWTAKLDEAVGRVQFGSPRIYLGNRAQPSGRKFELKTVALYANK